MARKLTRRQLEKLAESMEPRIRKAFLEAIGNVRKAASIKAVVAMIEFGRVEPLADLLGLNAASLAELAEAVRYSWVAAGTAAAGEIPPLEMARSMLQGQGTASTPTMRVAFRFDMHNPRAEAWLRQHSSRLVTSIIEDQRRAIRATVSEGMALGRNPRQTALDIVGRTVGGAPRTGGIVGLTEQQAMFVANARAELSSGDPQRIARYFGRQRRDKRFDASVRKAMASGKTLTPDQVDRIVGRYADRLLQLRGETIARTESIASMNAAREESYRQAIEAGDLDPENVVGTWGATGDRRTRHSHQVMNGQRRRFGEPFVAPSGARLMYPGDTSLGAGAEEIIACRCTKTFRIDFAAEVQRDR